MSVSRFPKILLVLVAAAATLVVGYLVATGAAGGTSDADEGGTVLAVPEDAVAVVPKATASQAAQAVSTRLFERSDVAVLTAADSASRAAAIATAERLQVPVLLDDPAAPAELARLRATTVLTFGETGSVVGATPITGDAAAAEQAVDAAVGPHQEPQPVEHPALVLMKSAQTFDVAAATARAAGATVVESSVGDPRRAPELAATLADSPDSPVVAVGAPFADGLDYTVAAVRAQATQLDGTYLALPGSTYIGVHGELGDPPSWALGRRSTDEALATVADGLPRHESAADAFGVDGRFVGLIEVVATGADPDELNAVLDAAQKAGVYAVLSLTPTDDPWLDQAKSFEDLLARPDVGLALDAGSSNLAVDDVDQVAGWLAEQVAAKPLPQKLFLVHSTKPAGLAELQTSFPELATVVQLDVGGPLPGKVAAWRSARTDGPKGVAWGWTERTPPLTIPETWRYASPAPAVVMYR